MLAGSDEVAPFICGAAVDEAPLLPGETTRLSLMVDDEICGDDANFSLVSMLSEWQLGFLSDHWVRATKSRCLSQ